MIATNFFAPFVLARAGARARGFSLVEMALVLLIVGLLAAVFLPATNTLLDNNRRKETRAKLEALEQAMVRFVMVNGRLPCPADGRLRSSNANYGLEQRPPTGVCTVTNQGVVPWRSLGLAANDAADAWNTQITYRTRDGLPAHGSLGLTLNRALDMGMCDPLGAGARDNQQLLAGHLRSGCLPCASANPSLCTSPLSWLTGRGLEVKTGNGTLVLMNPAVGTGAAYVLISHGANRHGGYPLGTSPLGPPINIITVDLLNRGDFENTNNSNNNAPQPFYVNIELSEAPGPNHFDDILLHPSVMSVVLAAGLGPRKQP